MRLRFFKSGHFLVTQAVKSFYYKQNLLGKVQNRVEQAFRYAEDKGYHVIPTCPFVDALLKREPGI